MPHRSNSLIKNLLPFFVVIIIFLSLPASAFYVLNEFDSDNSESFSNTTSNPNQKSTFEINSEEQVRNERKLSAEEQVRKEILELKKQQEMNYCEFCNGTGVEKNKSTLATEYGLSEERVCPACDGKGYIKI